MNQKNDELSNQTTGKTFPEIGDIVAFVGHEVQFSGVLTYKGNVRIDGTFDGDLTDKDKCIKIYKDNIERCKSEVPSDRLIEFDPSLGWEPLCRRLDCKIPQEPYPHVNKAAEFTHRWRNQKDPGK